MNYNLPNITGWMMEIELQTISQIAQDLPDNATIVEVGSMFGRSSVVWALSAPTATVYCIDRYEDWDQCFNADVDENINEGLINIPEKFKNYNSKQEFLKNTKDINNIVRIEGNSPHDIEYLGGEIDVFFLDAEHKNPSDWDNLCYFIPLIKAGGIVCGHDFSVSMFPDVEENVRKLEKIIGRPVMTFGRTTLWFFKLSRKITKEELMQ
jgi:predicted O-methyltransferase YrrM